MKNSSDFKWTEMYLRNFGCLTDKPKAKMLKKYFGINRIIFDNGDVYDYYITDKKIEWHYCYTNCPDDDTTVQIKLSRIFK